MPRPSKPHAFRVGARVYWRVRVAGKTHHLGADRREAMRRFHALMADGALAHGSSPASISGAAMAWLELHPGRWNEDRLARFVAFTGRAELRNLDVDVLAKYAIYLARSTYSPPAAADAKRRPKPRPLSAKTIRHYLQAAFAVLTHAHKRGWLRHAPERPRLPKPVRRAKDAPLAVVRTALDDLAPAARAVLEFVFQTGCRPGEACGLLWESVRLDAGVCVLEAHKTAGATGRVRTIYLNARAREILAKLHRPGASGPVFLSRRGAPYTPPGLRSILRRRGLNPYALRHSFAQVAADSVGAEVLGALLGHAHHETTTHYYEVRDARAAAAANAVGEVLNRM